MRRRYEFDMPPMASAVNTLDSTISAKSCADACAETHGCV